MQKLTIICIDNTTVTFTLKNTKDWNEYYNRYYKHCIKCSILQKTPYTKTEPTVLIGEPVQRKKCPDCEELMGFSAPKIITGILYYVYYCPECKSYHRYKMEG